MMLNLITRSEYYAVKDIKNCEYDQGHDCV